MPANTARVEKKQLTNFAIIHAIYFNGIGQKFNLKPTTLLVLIGLANHFNPDKKIVFPHQDYLSKQLNISESSVIRAIKELISNNLILKTRKQSGNVYGFTSVFFEAIKMTVPTSQPDSSASVKMKAACHEHDKINKINNRKIFKNSFSNERSGMNYHSAKPIIQQIEKDKQTKGSPLELPAHEAIAWFNNSPDFVKRGFFGKQIKKKYNL